MSASESKSLFSLAWPLMISFTFRALLTSIDLPYASLVGDSAMAAIGFFLAALMATVAPTALQTVAKLLV